MKLVSKIVFLMGLPGAGKTTYANNEAENNKLIHIIRENAEFIKNKNKALWLATEFGKVPAKKTIVIVDVLVTKNEDLRKLIDLVNGCFSGQKIHVSVVYWNEDREACKINDARRGRDVSAARSIDSLEYQVPDSKILGIPDKNILMKNVYVVPQNEAWVEKISKKYNPSYDHKRTFISSESWNGGGESWGWDDSPSTYSDPDPQKEFVKLDELLAEICPNISFLIYKKLFRECAEIKDTGKSDYYSNIHSFRWECDLYKLYSFLTDLGYNL